MCGNGHGRGGAERLLLPKIAGEGIHAAGNGTEMERVFTAQAIVAVNPTRGAWEAAVHEWVNCRGNTYPGNQFERNGVWAGSEFHFIKLQGGAVELSVTTSTRLGAMPSTRISNLSLGSA